MSGLSATGKTTLANALAAERQFQVISADVVRKELSGLSVADQRVEPFGSGLYRPERKRAVYEALGARAASELSRGQSVILDATFGERAQRESARVVARERGAYFFCIESRAEDDAVRIRMEERERRGSTSDARWPIYLRQRAAFEPIDELDDWSHIVVDTSAPLSRSVASVLAALDERLVPAGVRERGELPSLEA
jgi:predicted kinase